MGNQCVTALWCSLKEPRLRLQVPCHLDVSEKPSDGGGRETEASPRQKDPVRREGHTSQRSEDGGAFVHHQGTGNWLGVLASKTKETKTATHVKATEELPFGLLGLQKKDGPRSLQQVARPRTCSGRVSCGSFY